MYKIEIELPGNEIRFVGGNIHPTVFETRESADASAEQLFMRYGGDYYLRFSVVSPAGERVTDWEY